MHPKSNVLSFAQGMPKERSTDYVSLLGIEQVAEAKLLGATIDETLTWASHINNIKTKMIRSISIIRRSAYFLAKTATKQVKQSLVLSHLNYCLAIWSNTS